MTLFSAAAGGRWRLALNLITASDSDRCSGR
jgi:hypothetical protein